MYNIPMANHIKPMFVLNDSDGKRYKTIVVLTIPMANTIKLHVFLNDSHGKHYKTNVIVPHLLR